ncbi:MAG: DEAD/DEAH box helicase family protein, partial [Candidatus Aenigmatarchaeota archaeon]
MDMDLLVLQNFLASRDEDCRDSIVKAKKFSNHKTLYGYQIKALEIICKLLKLYYKDFSADKQSFFEDVYKDKVREYLDVNIKEKKIIQYLNLENNKIHFSELVNRASLWMATGSGKTLIIIKLIELL